MAATPSEFEGLCCLTAVRGSGAFFNSLQVLQRDLSVLAVRTHLDTLGTSQAAQVKKNGFSVLDAMCGGGVRAVRYALECPQVVRCVAVDLNPASVATARKTVEASLSAATQAGRASPVVEVLNGDCNRVMASMGGRPFGAVDLDPCGSPDPFLDEAVRCVASGGLLAVASTEDPALDPALCRRRYGGACWSREAGRCAGAGAANEVFVRLLLSRIIAAARAAGRRATPLLSLNLDFFRRVFVRIDDDDEEGGLVDPPGVFFRAVRAKKSDAWGRSWESVAGVLAADEEGWVAGPMFAGPLHDRAFAERLVAACADAVPAAVPAFVPFKSVARLRALLRLAVGEAIAEDVAVGAQVLLPHAVAKQTGREAMTGAAWAAVVEQLGAAGFAAAVAHASDGCGLKTDAPLEEALRAVRAAKTADGIASSGAAVSQHHVLNEDDEDDEDDGKGGAKKKRRLGGSVGPAFIRLVAAPSSVGDAALAVLLGATTPSACRDKGLAPPAGAAATFAAASASASLEPPPPVGLPAAVVNAEAVSGPELRSAIGLLLRRSAAVGGAAGLLAVGATSAWQPAGQGKDAMDDAAKEAVAARARGRVGQVIVVGAGAAAAVRRGAGGAEALQLAGRVAALHEFGCGGAIALGSAAEDGGPEEGAVSAVSGVVAGRSPGTMLVDISGQHDLRPLEAAEDLGSAIQRLRPFGVIVLRRGRHAPLARGDGAPRFPPLAVEGALLLGDDEWGAVVAGAALERASKGKGGDGGGKCKDSGAGGAGSGSDTLTVTSGGAGFAGLVIEVPPPPVAGHALCVSGGKASATLEGCLVRGATDEAPADGGAAASLGSGRGFEPKRRKHDGQQATATVRGALCASDGAFLYLSGCHVRGGFGERSRRLVAAAAAAAAEKASRETMGGIARGVPLARGASDSAPALTGPAAAVSAGEASGVRHQFGAAGLSVGGAGVFVVGKAVALVEGCGVDGVKGPGLEARRGGLVILRQSASGRGWVAHCGGAGVLAHNHGRASVAGPGVCVVGCGGEGALEVGSHGSLDVDGGDHGGGGGGDGEGEALGGCGVAVRGCRGHGVLAHAGASVGLKCLWVDRAPRAAVCARGDGTVLRAVGCVLSRCRAAGFSAGDGATLGVGPGNAAFVTGGGCTPGLSEEVSGGKIVAEA